MWISSGGISAFNAAWHAPEEFGRVISHCGSFVYINGGHNYPYLIRSTLRKPIRVFLTSGKRDGNIIIGNWPLANQQMAAALDFAGYDYRFEFGEGGIVFAMVGHCLLKLCGGYGVKNKFGLTVFFPKK